MIYRVSFSEDLASALAIYLKEKYQKDPFQLAKARLILPTKRACLSVKNAFAKLNKDGQSILLPKLMSLYELDMVALDIPLAITELERTLLLTELCRAKSPGITCDQAIKMAQSLVELLDLSYQFDNLDLSKLDTLVKEQFSTVIL